MTTAQSGFTYKNIEKLPQPPYIRKYTYPHQHVCWIFLHRQLDAGISKDKAMHIAKEWLDETKHSGYLVWHDSEMIPINRKSLIIDDDYKRWKG